MSMFKVESESLSEKKRVFNITNEIIVIDSSSFKKIKIEQQSSKDELNKTLSFVDFNKTSFVKTFDNFNITKLNFYETNDDRKSSEALASLNTSNFNKSSKLLNSITLTSKDEKNIKLKIHLNSQKTIKDF